MSPSGMTFEFIVIGAVGLFGAAIGGKIRFCRAWTTFAILTVAAHITVLSSLFVVDFLNGIAKLGDYTVFSATLLVFLTAAGCMSAFANWVYFHSHEEAAVIVFDRIGGIIFGFGSGVVVAGVMLFIVGSSPLSEKIPYMERARMLNESRKVLTTTMIVVNMATMESPSTVLQQKKVFNKLLLLAKFPAVWLEKTLLDEPINEITTEPEKSH
ncbi:MAG: hypothetical protein WA705_19125 [Candidatus Ozemobacteraceae bacterium]